MLTEYIVVPYQTNTPLERYTIDRHKKITHDMNIHKMTWNKSAHAANNPLWSRRII